MSNTQELMAIENDDTKWKDPKFLQLIKNQLLRSNKNNPPNDEQIAEFIFFCKSRGLNPIQREIYGIMRNGNIVPQVGIDGQRLIAHSTGECTGIERGLMYSDKGSLMGAWCAAYRKGNAYKSEVDLVEYSDPRSPLWKSKPKTMILKVAESHALRMAFPDHLGGIFTTEEMPSDNVTPQNEPVNVTPQPKVLETVTISIDTNHLRAGIDSLTPAQKSDLKAAYTSEFKKEITAYTKLSQIEVDYLQNHINMLMDDNLDQGDFPVFRRKYDSFSERDKLAFCSKYLDEWNESYKDAVVMNSEIRTKWCLETVGLSI